MRHKNGGSTGTTPTELPSTESKMNVEHESKMSLIFLMACFIGITSAFLIGYIFGIIGGIVFGTGYRNEFFSETFDDSVAYYGTVIPFIPAHLYICGIVAILFRQNHEFSRLDMRRHMILSGALVSVGSVVTAVGATGVVPITYVLGSTLYAFGFGLMYQGAQVYMSEMGFAHRNYLSTLNIAFKMMIAMGIFVANLVNCSTNNIKGGWGWKVSIGIAAIPAGFTSIGSYLLPDTPMSMIKLGNFDDAKQLLERLHGTNDGVHTLFKDLLAANEASKSAKGSEKQIMSQTHHRPYRLMAIALPLFQQLTGMSVIVFYAPYLFQAVGFRTSEALTYTAIVGGVNVAATVIGIISARQGCRRFFLIAGGVQLFVGQVMLGILIRIKLGGSDAYDCIIIATSCVCVSGFAWSWGPLGRIFLSSDDDMLLLFPLEVRSCGHNWASNVHWTLSSFITLVFPLIVCQFKFYVFYLFAFFGVIITFHAYYFMPNTNRMLSEEDVSKVWKQHWFWRRYFVGLNNDGEEVGSEVWKQHWFWRMYFDDLGSDLTV
ncbi:hypothetical protein MKW94_008439 [Papaver nudicaule]|uniref:Major facilitator superfamily (MFS) profile domain-containing protein n=1 Tax=Papaver nudicaule TaxID=74823 RepID=A0AA41VK91_PAPNU|nr:hypothetical protein [Papaver nudicaule]